MPLRSATRTPGYKAVLVADKPYSELKELQSHKSCGHLPVRFDLKDISTALVEVALETPGLKDRALQRALQNVAHKVVAAAGTPTTALTTKE